MTVAVYPGSFDPITLGHIDILNRASILFERIYVAVVKNPSKDSLLSLKERLELLKECTSHLKNVEVESFEGLTVNLAESHKAKVIIRGLRAVSDFEYEFMMSQMNKNLNPKIETVFMMTGLEYQFLSSSLVKEVAKLGGNVSNLVPPAVLKKLQEVKAAS